MNENKGITINTIAFFVVVLIFTAIVLDLKYGMEYKRKSLTLKGLEASDDK